MLVGARMTHTPITILPETPVTDAQALMRREKVHRLPVVDRRKRLVGIVTHKDLLYASPSPATSLSIWETSYLLNKLEVKKVMSTEIITVGEDTPLEDAARVMADNNIGGVPVMRGNVLTGIITESDLFKVFIELFGARERGVRVTMLIPEKKGELSQIASAIAAEGGNIISFGSTAGRDVTNCLATIKVSDIPQERLITILEPLAQQIIDVREG